MRKRGFLIFFSRLAILAALGAIVMLLWNWLMPQIFGLTTICYWQAAGLLLLARILFGHMCGRGGMHGHHGHHMRERWMQMTPQQREEFVHRRREMKGFGHFNCCDPRQRPDCAEPHTDRNE